MVLHEIANEIRRQEALQAEREAAARKPDNGAQAQAEAA